MQMTPRANLVPIADALLESLLWSRLDEVLLQIEVVLITFSKLVVSSVP